MSLPPPSAGPRGGRARELAIALEAQGRRRRRGGEGVLRLSALGAVLDLPVALAAPLKLPLGALQLGLAEPGAAVAGPAEGRFPVLKRLSPTAVLPREEGVEGWLWTSTTGSALTVLCGGDAPNAALLFTKPLGAPAVAAAFHPGQVAEIAARSPLGDPAVFGLLMRVADPPAAEAAFDRLNLLRPLTDREVPPTLRRRLPTDRSPDPAVAAGATLAGGDGSIAPPAAG